MILLVAGGRRFGHLRETMPLVEREARLIEVRLLRRALDHLHEHVERVDLLIVGAATGADTVAAGWAEDRGVIVEPYLADWDRFGRRAGPIRNQQMADALEARRIGGLRTMALLTPGGVGTADMRARLERRAFEIREIDDVLRDADAVARLQRRLDLDEVDKRRHG